jgi:hypothetical protein
MTRLDPLALTSFSLALGLAINAVLGPLLTGMIDYRYTETFENQGIGLDAFALVIAAPLLILAGLLSLRGHQAAPVLALGPALMAAYMLPQYVLGAHYVELPGNNEDFFLLHLGLFVLSGAVAVIAWRSIDTIELPNVSRRFEVESAMLLLAVAVFLLLRYVPFLFDVSRGDPGSEYRDDAVALWLIALMDLGIVLPIAIASGVALLLRVGTARKPMYAVLGWFALVGPAVASMGFAMVLNDDPHASVVGAVAFAGIGGGFALLAAYIFRPLFGPSAQQR